MFCLKTIAQQFLAAFVNPAAPPRSRLSECRCDRARERDGVLRDLQYSQIENRKSLKLLRKTVQI